jgi:hypothetical protein
VVRPLSGVSNSTLPKRTRAQGSSSSNFSEPGSFAGVTNIYESELKNDTRNSNNDVAAASEQLTNTLKWRREFNADKVANEEFPADVFGRLGILHGKSKTGEPITYNLYGEIKDNQVVFGDLDRFMRLALFLLLDRDQRVGFLTTI